MINFFYHPGYTKRKKKVFTIKLHESVIINKLINLTYFFNLTFPDTFITNGTHKCMNNTLKALKQNTNSYYNKDVYPNSYILQFDWYGEKVLNQLLNNKIKNKKILVGPLYTEEQLKKLSEYIQNYKFIKIIAASTYSAEKILIDKSLNIKKDDICIIPTGIISEKKLNNPKNTKRNEHCLIYYKNREAKDLQKITEFLNLKSIQYKLFEYGKYSNNDLKKEARKSRFCVMLNATESQGIALQEILAMNLPVYIWDLPTNKLNRFASSAPYFDSRCGIITNNYEEFINNFEIFIAKLNSFKPDKLVEDKLTFEKFINSLQNEFM